MDSTKIWLRVLVQAVASSKLSARLSGGGSGGFRRLAHSCRRARRSGGLGAAILLLIVSSCGLLAAAERLEYNRDIRPILSNNCFLCHGPDAGRREADLRLDDRDVAVDLGAISPGEPDDSELVSRIYSTDPDEIMPPPDSGKRLTDQQRATLRRWIAEGAAYQGHWAYEPPVKPQVPSDANAIDFLNGAHLAELGLRFAPEADRRTLARRLYFDLIGLPPSPDDVEAFIADASPDAYERLVARLLDSPHYGERMAIGWLDVVRFADTIGYHSDNPRNVWPYRDYVIRSFQENKPFDQFTVEQLAGDLLPDSGPEQKVASCFNRLLLTTEEGGAQAGDYELRMLTDRVRAVGTVWLGQTLGCCQCHDHKFDPATIRDFFSMGAFFADIQEPIIGRREAGMLVLDEQQGRELESRRKRVDELQRQYDSPGPEIAAARQAWEQQVVAEWSSDRWAILRPQSVESEHGTRLTISNDGVVSAEGNPDDGRDTYRVTVRTERPGIRAVRLDALELASLPSGGPGRASNGNFVLNEVKITAGDRSLTVARTAATFEQPNFPAAATVDGNEQPTNGWAILGGVGRSQAISFELSEPLADAGLTLVFTLRQQYGGNHVLGRFRLAAAAAPEAASSLGIDLPPPDILKIIETAPAQRDAPMQSRLTQYFQATAPAAAALRTQLAEARQALADFEAALPHCLVTTATSTPRTVRVMPRGNWMDTSGEVMQPALPAYLPHGDIPTDRRLTRLDLANWLVWRGNPLTARVFVNRLWKQFFGIALSKVSDDLGSQGEWPAQPKLLDWLACEFMDSGWDVKHMVRTIVTSRTYRQSSLAPRELQQRDPDNRELARQSRFRLDAELIRDNALAIAGLLALKIGGPSVKPYQPDGYWENLNFPPRTWVADMGESQYRRGLYIWWQRSFLHPSLLAFDAPPREECVADRPRSNTPQQALTLLNDPTYVEAARVFAARVLREGGADTPARLAWAWRQALQRAPRADELQIASALLEKHRAEYAQDSAAAAALLKIGQAATDGLDPTELAAWISVARVILNLHETVTRS